MTARQSDPNERVTAAVFRAEREDTTDAWAELARAEEHVAELHTADSVEGASARVGAVTASLRAGDTDRARALARQFSADPALSSTRRAAITAAFAAAGVDP